MMETVRADLYVLPELFNTGYNFADQDEVLRLAESDTGHTVSAMSEFSRKRSCYVVFGFAEKAERLYNTCALVGPGGLVCLYRKIHLFYREKLFFSPGDLPYPVAELGNGRVGMMICFDWIYPEAARTLALKGAQLIAHPSNLVLPHCPDAMVTRCLENRVFAAMVDRVGREDRAGIDLSFIGQSEIVSPRGDILIRLGAERPEICFADVDLSLADNKYATEHNHLFDDRRPEMYSF